MTKLLVCIPLRREASDGLAPERWTSPVQAFAPNDALLATFGYSPDMDEEAEHGALVLASLWGLLRHGQRCVLTAEVDQSQVGPGEEPDNGGVCVENLRRDQLVAFFIDPDENPDHAARAAEGMMLDEAWELAEVQELLGHELQWHDLGEWSR